MKKLAVFLAGLLLFSAAHAQAPTTTKPNVSNLLSPCLANVPVVGNGAAASPICHASGALGSAAFASTGTSGATIGLLNAANTWSALQTFNSGMLAATAPAFSGTITGTYTLGGAPSVPTTALTGTLQAAQAPAFTGDVTNPAGSLALAIDPSLLRGYLSGLTLSTAGASATFGIAAGIAVDSTNAGFMKLASAYAKTTGAWAVGTGNGGLDTGAIAINTWYHVFLMKRPDTGVVDVCESVTVTGCTTGGNIPVAYTLFRRIGSMKTNGSAQWIKFIQTGDEFLWDVSNLDVNAGAPTTTNTVYTLASIPTGISALAFLRLVFTNTAASASALVSSTLTGVQIANTPTGNANLFATAANAYQDTETRIWTNTSAQVNASGSAAANNQLFINTFGWSDRRGRDQ